jgi:hypothetical protein
MNKKTFTSETEAKAFATSHTALMIEHTDGTNIWTITYFE